MTLMQIHVPIYDPNWINPRSVGIVFLAVLTEGFGTRSGRRGVQRFCCVIFLVLSAHFPLWAPKSQFSAVYIVRYQPNIPNPSL